MLHVLTSPATFSMQNIGNIFDEHVVSLIKSGTFFVQLQPSYEKLRSSIPRLARRTRTLNVITSLPFADNTPSVSSPREKRLY